MKRTDFGKANVQLTCPVEGCGAPIHTNLNIVAANATVLCTRGHSVKLNTGSNELQRGLDGLITSFNRLNGKKFTIG